MGETKSKGEAPRKAVRGIAFLTGLGLACIAGAGLTRDADGSSQEITPRPGQLTPPAPTYDWRLEKSVLIPMRDDVTLATDLYFPVGAQGPLPVIFIKPGGYGKHNYRMDPQERQVRGDWMDRAGVRGFGRNEFFQKFGQDHNTATWFASHGYVVAVQDARGRFESGGRYTISKDHSRDIYDTIDWLAAQSWSNKHVGMIGCSYAGEVQLYQAARSHPALKTIVPQGAGTAVGSAGGFYMYAQIFNSGILPLGMLAPWYHRHLLGPYQQKIRPPGLTDDAWKALAPLVRVPARPKVDWRAALQTLPEVDVLARAGLEPNGLELTSWRDFVARFSDVNDPWWDEFDFVEEGSPIHVPALFTDSWYDLDPRVSFYLRDMYQKTGTSAVARDNQFLIVAPTSHCEWDTAGENYALGPLAIGDARFGHFAIYLSWFDHWLKGVDNAVTEMPKIQYFVIGENEWRATDRWPLPQTQFRKLFLGSGGRANSALGDGVLDWSEPSGGAASDSFTYDPRSPVPSAGLPFCDCTDIVVDQQSVANRIDVLVYSTPPLPEDLELTGPVDLVLHFSSSAPDTDLFAKLVEVYPDGRALNIYEAARRLRFRESRETAKLMTPGQVYRVELPITQMSRVLRKGHRLRLQITSSSFPAWGRNLNTGGDNLTESDPVVAINSVHHSREHPSYLVLPVIPQAAEDMTDRGAPLQR